MNTVQKTAVNALHTAALALAAATAALAASFEVDTPAEAPKAAPAKKTPAAKPAEPPAEPAKPAESPAESPAKPAEAAQPAGDILDRCRKAAQEYAGVYGREGLRKVLDKYTTKTLADVAPEKLPELLKDLS